MSTPEEQVRAVIEREEMLLQEHVDDARFNRQRAAEREAMAIEHDRRANEKRVFVADLKARYGLAD